MTTTRPRRLRGSLLAVCAAALASASAAGAGHDSSNVFHLGALNTHNGQLNTALEGTYTGAQLGVATSGVGGIAVYGRTEASTGDGKGIWGETESNDPASFGVYGRHLAPTGTGPGVVGETSSQSLGAAAVRGVVVPTAVGGSSAGVRGINNGTSTVGYGVWGEQNGSGVGVYGETPFGRGVYGLHSSITGADPGVRGQTNSGSANAAGVQGVVTDSTPGAGSVGVYGQNNGAGALGIGVRGGVGVYGAHGGSGYGVYGNAFGAGGAGVVGQAPGGGGWAGYFTGNVHATGTLSKGGGAFKIDHPLDPQNRYLQHSFVESPDMMNVYNGNVRTDVRGVATVRLPHYFGALNRDFRYQLTAIGQPAQIWIARKIRNNRFTIRTDKPNVEVSWQVTGIRKDRWANANRIQVEQAKAASERGRYLIPELYGASADKSLLKAPPKPGMP